ncbi:hypothetical protein C8J56DRAFT_840017, partial [Mycena floridula]
MSDDIVQEEDPVWGDWGPSLYNDNKGITVKITLFYLPDPTVRARANARPPSDTVFSAFHEDYSFNDFLALCCSTLDRNDLIIHSSLFNYGNIDPDDNSFTLKYDIVGTNIKGISIRHGADFKTMVEKVTERAKLNLSLYFTELAVKLPDDEQPARDGDGQPDEDEDEEINARRRRNDEDDEDDANNISRSRKRRRTESTDEEEDQAEKIIQLQDTTRCEDSHCNNYTNFCLVIGPQAYHVFLYPKHFRIWSTAWAAGVPGIDETNPPNNRIFDVDSNNTNTSITDINLLASRRHKSSSASGSEVNVSFPGFAEAIARMSESRNVSPEVRRQSTPSEAPSAPTIPPKMDLAVFVCQHQLSATIHEKLRKLDISGPHILRLMENSELAEGGLSNGQIAVIQDAEQHFLHGV